MDKLRFGVERRVGVRVFAFIVDESHRYKTVKTSVWQAIMDQVAFPGNPYMIIISATALESGPLDLLLLCVALEKRRPESKAAKMTGDLKSLLSENIKSAGKIWALVLKKKEEGTNAVKEVQGEMRKATKGLLVQRSARTDFGGGPCLKMPKVSAIQNRYETLHCFNKC